MSTQDDSKDAPIFASVELVARIERAEGALLGAAAAARQDAPGVMARPLGGGLVVWTRPGSPLNKLVGLGFAPLDEGELEAAEVTLAERGQAAQAEIATLAGFGVPELLTRRGYFLVGFEDVLGRRIAPARAPTPPPGLQVRRARPEEHEAWVDAVLTGFANPDDSVERQEHDVFDRAALEQVFRDLAAVPGLERWVAVWGGRVVGGANLRVDGGLAQLAGAATVPSFRRRGVQSALLEARLAAASARGADLAVITTQPGSKSQLNAQRAGFQRLYTRCVLVRPRTR